jgi:hypothetical protein
MVINVVSWIILTIITKVIFNLLGLELTFNTLLLTTIVWGFVRVCGILERNKED